MQRGKGGQRSPQRLVAARDLAAQFVVVAGAALLYFAVRGITEGSEEIAVSKAETLMRIESRLGLNVESTVQALILDQIRPRLGVAETVDRVPGPMGDPLDPANATSRKSAAHSPQTRSSWRPAAAALLSPTGRLLSWSTTRLTRCRPSNPAPRTVRSPEGTSGFSA